MFMNCHKAGSAGMMITSGTLRLVHSSLNVAWEKFLFIDPLTGSSVNTDDPLEHVIRLDDLELARGRIGRVFRGQVQDSSPNLRVIVKLVAPTSSMVKGPHGPHRLLYPRVQRKPDVAASLLSDLAHEARIYASSSPGLRSLQGTVVPLCLGYTVNEHATSACLILEDAGEALAFPYKRLPFAERSVLLFQQYSPLIFTPP